MIPRRLASSLSATALLVSSLLLAGCGEDTEQLCSAVDDLQASIADLTDVQVEPGALATLQGELEQVQTDLGDVRDEATDEYADEVDLVQKAAASAALAIDFAVTSPSADTLADVVPAIELLGTRLKDLTEAVEGTC